jgi:glycogen phosphorylase
VFTTHTPVPAGNETFDVGLLRPHLDTLRHELGLEPDEIISWGQAGNGQPAHETSMTILGLRMARFSNGVSELHGRVARGMWKHLWPECPEDEVPIIHITNGVHVSSWLSPDNAALFDRYLGTDWREKAGDEESLAHLAQIPDEELWRAHELGRSRLVRVSREIMETALRHRNATKAEVAHAKSILDQDALTIGFARRFATYKRGNLLLRDPERIIAMLTNTERPVQLLFAGKSHPADDSGKDFIRQIVHFARKANLSRRIIFLENYDIHVARTMVQGVDVWLNTPRRPLEASGTSGMKAALNGALHLSVLDGWWCEGYSKECGWAIGHGEEYDDPNYQDTVESLALYNLLENEVIPAFYDRQASDLPLRWLKMMKASMSMALGYFSSHRMVNEYSSLFYKKAGEEYIKLTADNHATAKTLVKQQERLASLWNKIKLTMPVADREISSLHVGDTFAVNSTVQLGDLKPDEVEVQIYYGPVNSENQILESHVYPMTQAEELGHGRYMYRHNITCKISGRYALSARVTPAGSDWKGTMPGHITWAAGSTL